MSNTKTVARLRTDVYTKFAERFRPIQPNEATTAIQVGYALGVERVLSELRKELVVEDATSN